MGRGQLVLFNATVRGIVLLLSLALPLSMLYNAEAFYYPPNHGWRVAKDGLNILCYVGWKRSAR